MIANSAAIDPEDLTFIVRAFVYVLISFCIYVYSRGPYSPKNIG